MPEIKFCPTLRWRSKFKRNRSL